MFNSILNKKIRKSEASAKQLVTRSPTRAPSKTARTTGPQVHMTGVFTAALSTLSLPSGERGSFWGGKVKTETFSLPRAHPGHPRAGRRQARSQHRRRLLLSHRRRADRFRDYLQGVRLRLLCHPRTVPTLKGLPRLSLRLPRQLYEEWDLCLAAKSRVRTSLGFGKTMIFIIFLT